MTFMRIFPFEVRVFAYFTLKQGKKQEPQQIKKRQPWRKGRMPVDVQAPLCHIESSYGEMPLFVSFQVTFINSFPLFPFLLLVSLN